MSREYSGQLNRRYKFLFDNSPIPIFETNFSSVVPAIKRLKAEGVEDIEAYLSNHPDFVANLYLSSNIFDVNQAMIDLMQADNKAAFIKDFKAVLGNHCYNFFQSILIALFNDKNIVQGESKVITFKGHEIWVEATAVFLIFEGEEVVNYTFKEITEDKLKTEAIRLINERMRQGSIRENLENLVLSLSEVFRLNAVILAVPTQDKSQVKTLGLVINNKLQENITYKLQGPCFEIYQKGELVVYHSNLQEIFADVDVVKILQIQSFVGFPLRDRKNKIIGHLSCGSTEPIAYLSVLKDILSLFASWASSEIIHLQNKRELENKTITIEQQLADLSQKKQKLEQYFQSNELLQNFAYIASHDLKAPIRTIVSFSQLLKRSLSDKLDEDSEEFLEFILSASKNMKDLIDDLLLFSRIDNQVLNIDELYVEDIFLAVVSDLQSIIREKNALIQWEGTVEKINGDFIKLKQLFQNLIFNAMKFQQIDNQPIITVRGTDEGDCWQFSVEDNGIGIEEDYFDRIFNLFQKIHAKTVYEGTGLGLAICKRIVEKHQGKIWLTSKLGKGSTFYFTVSK